MWQQKLFFENNISIAFRYCLLFRLESATSIHLYRWLDGQSNVNKDFLNVLLRAKEASNVMLIIVEMVFYFVW